MAVQLAVLLLLGLLAAHVIALSLVQPSGEIMHSISRDQLINRVVVAYRLAQLPLPQARDALQASSDGGARFSIDATGPVMAQTNDDNAVDEKIVGDALRQRLQLEPTDLQVQLQQHGMRAADLMTSIRLADGQWVNSVQAAVITQWWWRPLRFSVPVSTLPVLVIVFLFVRRILRPIKALAQAAEKISRGEQIAPLPVSGPSEAREVTQAFNLMQERLSRFVDDRTRMLAAISHDLRTPITSLRLRAELVDDAPLKAAMIRTLEEMRVMVNETLHFARDEARTEDTQEVDLHLFMQQVVQEQRAQGREVDLCPLLLDLNGLPPAAARAYRCRPLNLQRALNNLIDNAVHYGQRARLQLQLLPLQASRQQTPEASADMLQISIEDDGPGIDAAQLEEVFKPFFRLDPARHYRNGSVGLGLSIARSCIEAHGGSLHLENRPATTDTPGQRQSGAGLRAVICLPA